MPLAEARRGGRMGIGDWEKCIRVSGRGPCSGDGVGQGCDVRVRVLLLRGVCDVGIEFKFVLSKSEACAKLHEAQEGACGAKAVKGC